MSSLLKSLTWKSSWIIRRMNRNVCGWKAPWPALRSDNSSCWKCVFFFRWDMMKWKLRLAFRERPFTILFSMHWNPCGATCDNYRLLPGCRSQAMVFR